MALYRRFAVYLYQYQGARKGAGAGFGMIELRDGRIRMQLTGRGSAAQGNLEVYGLLDAPAEMAGVRLGSMQAGRFVLEAGEDIGEGKLFSDLRGIVLTARPGSERAVAALWNGTFDAGKFVQWKAEERLAEPEGEVQLPFQEAFSTDEMGAGFGEEPFEGREDMLCEEEKSASEEGIQAVLWEDDKARCYEEEFVQLCREDRTECREEAPAQLWRENSTECDKEVSVQRWEEKGTRCGEEDVLQLWKESKEELCEETSPSDIQAEVSCMDIKEGVSSDISSENIRNEAFENRATEAFSQEEEGASDSVPLWKNSQNPAIVHMPQSSAPHLNFASAALDLVEFGTPLEIETGSSCVPKSPGESILWQRLSKQYPKMNIPMQQGPLSCLRIRPCDINRLPKENWRYGCSHFLARHYNRYRCLILGRTQHKNGWEYFMGVPGGNGPQERKEAAAAGFDHYIAVEKGHGQWPEGFWLVQLQWME